MAPLTRKPVPPPRSQYAGLEYAPADSMSDLSDLGITISNISSETLQPAVAEQSTKAPKSALKTTEYQVLERDKTSPWGIHWYSPALMLGLFLTGIASAMAHHFFYNSLNLKDVESNISQEWAIRIGTGLAFTAKACLAASVGVAYTQRLWATLRRKPITLQAVDDLFLLTMNPTSFFSREVLWKAKLLCFMAASMWCIPLVATITPATLSIGLTTRHNFSAITVPILDFTAENSHRYYSEELIRRAGMGEDDPTVADNSTGMLQGPSISLRQLFRAVATGGNILQFPPSFPNTTFELQFYGPSVQCYNLTATNGMKYGDTAANNPAEKREVEILRNISTRAQSNYWAAIDVYNPYQASYWGLSGEGWKPVTNKVVLVSEDELYDGIKDRTKVLDTYHVLLVDQYQFSCMLWNTSYTVDFSSTVFQQSITSYDLELINERAYKGYSELFRTFIIGGAETIPIGRGGWSQNNEHELLSSNLKYCPEFNRVFNLTGRVEKPGLCTNHNLMGAIESLSYNVTLSLLTSGEFSGKIIVDAKNLTYVNQYFYHPYYLFIAYGVAILVALLGIIIGGFSYITNGYSASMSFSSIVFTTRNHALDHISEGRCLPALPLGKELGKTKLRYGLLRSDGTGRGHDHAAFGFADTITELRKGTRCM